MADAPSARPARRASWLGVALGQAPLLAVLPQRLEGGLDVGTPGEELAAERDLLDAREEEREQAP